MASWDLCRHARKGKTTRARGLAFAANLIRRALRRIRTESLHPFQFRLSSYITKNKEEKEEDEGYASKEKIVKHQFSQISEYRVNKVHTAICSNYGPGSALQISLGQEPCCHLKSTAIMTGSLTQHSVILSFST